MKNLVKTNEQILVEYLISLERLLEQKVLINKDIEFIKKQMYKLVKPEELNKRPVK